MSAERAAAEQAQSGDSEDLEALFDQVAAERAQAETAQSGDSPELEALFEEVAAQSAAAAASPAAGTGQADAEPAAEKSVTHAGDSPELEALFEEVAAQAAAQAAAVPAPEPRQEAAHGEMPLPEEMFQRIGMLTRTLHDALRELGYDKAVEDAVNKLPDARDRLSYIAELTGKAAERALNAVELGQQYQKALEAEAKRLAAQWDRVFAGELPLEDFKHTAVETRTFLKNLPLQTEQTYAQFTEIMMAQDFHDLTGQVIQRILKLAQNLESQLVKLLIDATPPDKRPAADSEWLSGPAMNAANRDDVVTNQQQVDELLESLGF
ncbi:MAG: protein phosphatase CheZ [Burkholderiales bacterium]|nr:protein phosphatase CheZ [Burkholderiales bacterium]